MKHIIRRILREQAVSKGTVKAYSKEDYILASTLVIESFNGSDDELYTILASIKNRADKCGKTMQEMVLLPKQYSTWNYYNSLSSEKEKNQELKDRFKNHLENKNLKKFLTIVKSFKSGSKDYPYNHYVTNNLITKYESGNCGNNGICKSYKENKESSKKVGEHTFWWADNHRCS